MGKEEVLLEGVDVVMEAEEKDLSVGVVCTKKDEEPGPCGSAAHFLLGMEMEGDPPVTEKVEGDPSMAVSADLCFKTNDSNKCQFSSPIDVAAAVNDDQVDVGFAVDNDSDIESTAAVDDAHVGLGISLRTRLRPTPIFLNSTPGLHRRNSVRVHPYAHPRHIKVLKHFVYI